MTTWGTAYFVSRNAAERYYRRQFGGHAKQYVEDRYQDGTIKFGKPNLNPGERLVLLDGATRYGIEDDE
jgi:hypothetical protein